MLDDAMPNRGVRRNVRGDAFEILQRLHPNV
jgi:hypothetical protein